MRTEPHVLDMLRRGGTLPVYWRRKRLTSRWHRGFRQGSILVRSQCEQMVDARGGRVLFTSIDEPWPTPHCQACERATPGTNAAREGLDPNEGVRYRRPVRR